MRYPMVGVTLTIAAVAVGQVVAQTTLSGRILAAAERTPLSGADVFVEGLEKGTRSDDSGYFRITAIPIGDYTVRIARAGFQTGLLRLRVKGARTADVEIALPATAPEATTATSITRDGFDARRARRRPLVSQVVSREELRRRDGLPLADVLRDHGVRIAQDQAGNRYAVTSGQSACPMRVVADGVIKDGGAILDLYSVAQLERIEIYRRAIVADPALAGTGATCGVLRLYGRTH